MGISPFLAHVPINLSPSHCNIAWASPPHGSQKLAALKQIYSDISINNVMQCVLLFAFRFPRTYISIEICFTELFRLTCLLYLASVFPQDALHQMRCISWWLALLPGLTGKCVAVQRTTWYAKTLLRLEGEIILARGKKEMLSFRE